jgi:hypothetical protein
MLAIRLDTAADAMVAARSAALGGGVAHPLTVTNVIALRDAR